MNGGDTAQESAGQARETSAGRRLIERLKEYKELALVLLFFAGMLEYFATKDELEAAREEIASLQAKLRESECISESRDKVARVQAEILVTQVSLQSLERERIDLAVVLEAGNADSSTVRRLRQVESQQRSLRDTLLERRQSKTMAQEAMRECSP